MRTLLEYVEMFAEQGAPGHEKTAEEELFAEAEAAGRIQARGFADEMAKLANAMAGGPPGGAGVSGDPSFTSGGPMYGAGQGAGKKPPAKKKPSPAVATEAAQGTGKGMC